MRKLLLSAFIVTVSFLGSTVLVAQERAAGNDSVYSRVDTPPVFPGGEQGLFRYMGENMVYPAQALEQKMQGKVYCRFVIEKDGSISDVQVVRSSQSASLDEEALRLVRAMPNWTPGEINGESVRMSYVLPVIFRIKEDTVTQSEANNTDSVYVVVDKMPEFVGGQQALFNYLSNEVSYPVEAQEKGIEGRVICSFVVGTDGKVSDVALAKSSGNIALDKEAVRVVHSMPNWVPGSMEGKPVRVRYSIPINFSLLANPDKNYKKTNAQEVLQKYLDEHFEYEPVKSGLNDIYSLVVRIPLLVTVDSTGVIHPLMLYDKIKSEYKYVKGRETYEEKDGRKVRTISEVSFDDNNSLIAYVNEYCSGLESALKDFVESMNDAYIKCRPSMRDKMPYQTSVRVTLYRDGMKKYHTKKAKSNSK